MVMSESRIPDRSQRLMGTQVFRSIVAILSSKYLSLFPHTHNGTKPTTNLCSIAQRAAGLYRPPGRLGAETALLFSEHTSSRSPTPRAGPVGFVACSASGRRSGVPGKPHPRLHRRQLDIRDVHRCSVPAQDEPHLPRRPAGRGRRQGKSELLRRGRG